MLVEIYNGISFYICVCRVRFHYGHPDVFDRIFHLTRGGVSKASKVINLSEDIFAGKVVSISFFSCFNLIFICFLCNLSLFEFHYVICRL